MAAIFAYLAHSNCIDYDFNTFFSKLMKIFIWLHMFTQPFIQAQIKENIKAPRHWPLWGEFTGDRWIPLTKGQ